MLLDSLITLSNHFYSQAQQVVLEPVTIVGDPNASPEPKKQQTQPTGQPIKLPWKPITGFKKKYGPKETQHLKNKGFRWIEPLGWVPPENVSKAKMALNKGWKDAGGYGLVPPDWYNYLKQQGMIA